MVVDEVNQEVEVATNHQKTAEERPEQPPAHHIKLVVCKPSDYPD